LIDNQFIRAKLSIVGRTIDSAHAWTEELVHAGSIVKKNPNGSRDLAGQIASQKVLTGQHNYSEDEPRSESDIWRPRVLYADLR
jgi:hypothetical protein